MTRNCAQCGTEFKTFQSKVDRGNGRFCSRKCFGVFWKGPEVLQRADGYRYARVPEHPRANAFGLVYEHFVVAEKLIGRLLMPKEVVHHKDHNPSNNVPENLMVLADQKEHMRQHAIERLTSLGGRPGLDKFCPRCKTVLSLDLFSPSTSRGKKTVSSNCKKCRAIYEGLRYKKRTGEL